jgi:hypothetical protein
MTADAIERSAQTKEDKKPEATLFMEPTNGGKNHGGLGPPPSPGTFPIGM